MKTICFVVFCHVAMVVAVAIYPQLGGAIGGVVLRSMM